jgi:hypothetical protein
MYNQGILTAPKVNGSSHGVGYDTFMSRGFIIHDTPMWADWWGLISVCAAMILVFIEGIIHLKPFIKGLLKFINEGIV